MSLLNSLKNSLRSDPDSYSPPSGIPAPAPTQELVLYKFDACPYCRRVMNHIDELGLSEVVYRDTRLIAEARGELLEATGDSQVPCLFIDGTPLLESRDINAWLTAYARVKKKQQHSDEA